MTSTLLQFGAVMLVVMIGFAMALHVLSRDDNSFGETLLGLFKAMLGDTDFFDEFSGGRFDLVATILFVAYLLIFTIMLLNLLIAILSTAHAQVQENVEGEFKLSKARIVAYYRMVVDEGVLPVPFNLVQLVLSMIIAALWCGCGCLGRAHDINPAKEFVRNASGAAVSPSADEQRQDSVGEQEQMEMDESVRNDISTEGGESQAGEDSDEEGARIEVDESTKTHRHPWEDAYKNTVEGFGLIVFWLVLGPVALAGGALLSILSALPLFPYAQYEWHKRFKHMEAKTRASDQKRRSPMSKWGFIGWRWVCITVWSVAVAPVCLSVMWFLAALRVLPYGADGAREPSKRESTSTIESMLKKGPGGVGVDKLREFLEDPMNDKDVRHDERDRKTTVEHIKLLRNRLEMTTKQELQELQNHVKSEMKEVLERQEAIKKELKEQRNSFAARNDMEKMGNDVAKLQKSMEEVLAFMQKLNSKSV